jgi:SAM-dependent methyltransferase
MISLDIERSQLVKNAAATYRIQADLHSNPLMPESVDMIICFNVIEHLEAPELALKQLSQALKPGGLMVVGCPARSSLKGIITRLTPIGFHRWYYRWIVGKKDRGEGHFDVFPTPFKPIVDANPLRRWCEAEHLDVLFFETYDGAKAYEISYGSVMRRIASLPYYVLTTLGRIFSLGRWKADESDLLMVVVK